MLWKLFKVTGRAPRLVLLLKATQQDCKRRMAEVRGKLKAGEDLLLVNPAGKVWEVVAVR